MAGLSALEEGPTAPFLVNLLNSSDCEAKAQFSQGVQKTGIYQKIIKKGAADYMHPLSQVYFSSNLNDGYCFPAGRREPLTLSGILNFITGSSEEPVVG
ncbi:hypothetical protein KUTeg_000044 [Tegillarca granosa]|uniref:Uncharacterized protein n=1 Tax=Tegillarca granosa TaxID=220873 RepID=A0ABQ9G1Y9_TEGGR|nr:hypothetical protein KUTeg_000044 [Tegillarca granosa]